MYLDIVGTLFFEQFVDWFTVSPNTIPKLFAGHSLHFLWQRSKSSMTNEETLSINNQGSIVSHLRNKFINFSLVNSFLQKLRESIVCKFVILRVYCWYI